MQPVSPVLPGHAVQEVYFAKEGSNLRPLPAVLVDGDNVVLMRWQLSPEDRQRIADGQDVYMWMTLGHDQSIRPMSMEVTTPDEICGRTDKVKPLESTQNEEWPEFFNDDGTVRSTGES